MENDVEVYDVDMNSVCSLEDLIEDVDGAHEEEEVDAFFAALPVAHHASAGVEPEEPNPHNDLGYAVLALFDPKTKKGLALVRSGVTSDADFEVELDSATSVEDVLTRGTNAAQGT